MSRDSTTVITGAPSHRYGYRGGGAARDRAAGGTAEADAAGEAPGGRLAWPRARGRQRPRQETAPTSHRAGPGPAGSGTLTL